MNAREQLRENLRALALLIGLRPAARKLGIVETTATMWASRHNWKLSETDNFAPLRTRSGRKMRSTSDEVSLREGIERSLREVSDETRLYLGSAALKAGFAAAGMEGSEILGKDRSIGVLNAARTADVVHGWTAQRTQGAQVAVQVNVPLPSAEERAERKELHAKLDEIFALKRAQRTPHTLTE